MGERQAVQAREITKKFEEFTRAPLSQLLELAKGQSPRGEYTLILSGCEAAAGSPTLSETDLELMLTELIEVKGMSKKAAIT